MGDIIPFISRLVGKLDWTAGERARIQKLADGLADGSGGVEVTFGRSDAGEPWCALTGDDGEVLVHVARIGGRFVVHHAPEDVFASGPTLWSALEEALGEAWGESQAPEFAEVVPLPLQARQTHLLSVLIVASALLDGVAETPVELVPPAESEFLPPTPLEPAPQAANDPAAAESAPTAPALETPVKSPGASLKVASLALYEPAVAEAAAPPARAAPQAEAPDRPAESAAASEAPLSLAAAAETAEPPRIAGTDGDDTLTGTARAEVLQGGAGDDHLDGGGAELGGVDRLEGGAGNDTLVLNAQTLAAGGEGADSFVITRAGPGAEANLGVVLDFTPADGDRLTGGSGEVVVVAATPDANVLAHTPGAENAGPPGGLPGYRVSVDVDNDGQSDGVVFVAGTGLEGYFPPGPRPPAGGAPDASTRPPEPPPSSDAAEPPLRLLGGAESEPWPLG